MPLNKDRHAADVDAEDFHIAGIVVHARFDAIDRVTQALQCLPGAQVHGASADGKLVLTLEGSRASALAEQLSAIQALPDVMSVALVYQHHEQIDSLNEDNFNETDSSRIH